MVRKYVGDATASFVNALTASNLVVAPVPPLAIATVPVTLAAVPVIELANVTTLGLVTVVNPVSRVSKSPTVARALVSIHFPAGESSESVLNPSETTANAKAL